MTNTNAPYPLPVFAPTACLGKSCGYTIPTCDGPGCVKSWHTPNPDCLVCGGTGHKQARHDTQCTNRHLHVSAWTEHRPVWLAPAKPIIELVPDLAPEQLTAIPPLTHEVAA